jgi:hypothetical protein
MNRRDIAILALCCALLGVAVFRLLSPSEGATRRISVEAVVIGSSPIASGAVTEQEARWTAPDDVFIVGWTPTLGAAGASPELHLLSGKTSIFSAQASNAGSPPSTFFPAGSGFLVRKGEMVRLQLRMKNSGPDGETLGARALIYFHPVAWR